MLIFKEKSWETLCNIGYIKYEKGEVNKAIGYWKEAEYINNLEAEPQLAIAVALYAQGEEKKAIEKAQKALALDKSLADLETLKKNLWGHRLLVEAEKLIPLSLT